MTQEEKSKVYDEALERAKECHIDGLSLHQPVKDVIEHIFPELKESEDEKIRKALISMFKGYNIQKVGDFTDKEIIAWLEKQAKLVEEYEDRLDRCACESFNKGYKAAIEHQKEKQGEQEQDPCEHCKDKCLNCHNFPCIEKRAFEQGKSVFNVINEEKVDNADKTEPKFKVGDWVVYNYPNTVNPISEIIQIDRDIIDLKDTNGSYFQTTISELNCNYHLWNISDAKDGDVLTTYTGRPFIFKGCLDERHPNSPVAYCGVNYDNCFFVSSGISWWTDENVYPATKEQHDTLMKAIADAGYVFDFEKKELKLLITNGGDFDEKNCEQKHSIDINKMVNDYANNRERGNEEFGKPVPCMIRAYRQGLNDAIGKVVLKPAWSEEEIEKAAQEWESKANFNSFYMTPTGVKQDITSHEESFKAGVNWILKSLRPQNRWKPSDEQLDALHNAAVYVMFPYPKGILMKLYKQLKKLRGE